MAHSISLPDDVYSMAFEEAKSEHRTIPKQIAYWAKLARAAKIAMANNTYIDDVLETMDASEKAARGEGIIIEDIDAYFKSISGRAYKKLGKNKSKESAKD